MILAHGGAASTGGPEAFLPAVVLGLTAAAAGSYAVLARRQARRHGSWSGWRTVSFVTGAGLLGMALVPALSPFPAGDFRGHMLQHLLIGMYAPLLLVMGAPATLLLRTLPPRHGRVLGRLLHVAPLRVVTHPVTALVLNLGGLLVLYLTPLYVATTQRPVLHHLVHLHFLVAGYLFAHAIAGPDPAPSTIRHRQAGRPRGGCHRARGAVPAAVCRSARPGARLGGRAAGRGGAHVLRRGHRRAPAGARDADHVAPAQSRRPASSRCGAAGDRTMVSTGATHRRAPRRRDRPLRREAPT